MGRGVDAQLATGLLIQPAQQVAGAQVLDGLGAAQVEPDMIGADVFRAGQGAQIAHDAGVEQRGSGGQLATAGQGNALLHRNATRTGAVSTAAVAAVGTPGARGGQAVWQAGDRLVSPSRAPARQQPGTEERPSNPRCGRPARRVPVRVCDRPACGGSRGRRARVDCDSKR